MHSKIENQTERKRTLARLRKRKQNKSNIAGEASIYDIPKELEASRYWRRWSQMKKEVAEAFRRWQLKQAL